MTERSVIHGLVIESPFALAGQAPDRCVPTDVVVQDDGDQPSVEVRSGEVLARVHDPSANRRHVLRRLPRGWELDFPGAAVFSLSEELDVVRVLRVRDVGSDLLAVLASGPLTTTLAMLAGRAVVHASAVVSDGGAVAFAGPPGSGKSTLAALLARAGHPVFSDDALAIGESTSNDEIMVHRGTVVSRLRPGSRVGLGRDPDAVTGDGRHAYRSDDAGVPDVLPLRAVCVPMMSPRFEAVKLHRLEGAQALSCLGPALDGLSGPSLVRAHFDAAADVAVTVPVFALGIPWGEAGPPPLLAEQIVDALSGAR